MAKKKKPSIQDKQNGVESGGTSTQRTISLTRELLELQLSEGQCRTILKYAELPAHLAERLAAKHTVAKGPQFTLDEGLDRTIAWYRDFLGAPAAMEQTAR